MTEIVGTPVTGPVNGGRLMVGRQWPGDGGLTTNSNVSCDGHSLPISGLLIVICCL